MTETEIDHLITFAAAVAAVRRAARAVGLDDLDTCPAPRRRDESYQSACRYHAILDAIEPSELKRSPMVRHIILRAVAGGGA